MPTLTESFNWLRDEGPRLFPHCNGGSLLYVGHRRDTHPWWHRTFAKALGCDRIAVLDIVRDNLMSAAGITSELYLGDVRDESLYPEFDLVLWDEGPEHMPRQDSLDLLTRLMRRHRSVLISCPWGYQPQGDPNDPTDFEFHHWGPNPADFSGIGMETRVFGTQFDGRGNGHGNLIAWATRRVEVPASDA